MQSESTSYLAPLCRHVGRLCSTALCGMLLLLLVAGCNQQQETSVSADESAEHHVRAQQKMAKSSTDDEQSPVTAAVAMIKPTKGNTAEGTITITQAEDGKVSLHVQLSGLTPGEHGFHVHEVGDCSADDGTSAGGHYAPKGHKHGAPDGTERHAGDLGNVTADENGVVDTTLHDTVIELNGSESIVGRAFIVHQDPDDLTSQPTGNAGARVACGVIEAKSAT